MVNELKEKLEKVRKEENMMNILVEDANEIGAKLIKAELMGDEVS